MPLVPQFNREEKLNGAALPYQNYQINENTFGVSVGRAVDKLSNSMNIAAHAIDRINEYQEHIKGMEFNNAIEDWKQQKLYDKENGYFVKQGKDASGKTEEVMKDFDEFINQWQSSNKLSKFNQARLDQITKYKRSGIMQSVTAHDLKETQKWAGVEGAMGINNAITDAVSDRDNPEGIKLQIANIRQITRWQGETIGLDEDSIKAAEIANVSKAYSAILNAKLELGDPSAKEFFNEHKNEINSELHAKYMGAIKDLDDKYKARDLANEIIASSKNLQEATAKYEKIKDVTMSDAVGARVRAHYSQEEHFKREEQKELLNDFYTKAVEAAQNGTPLSYDDIDSRLDPDTKLSLMNYVNTKGQPNTYDEVWDELYSKSVNDAQGFVNEDLNKYRGFLSDSDYKSFVKRQEEIRSGGYYTTIKDDNEMIDSALEAMHLNGNTSILGMTGKNRDIAYSEIRSLVREFEARKGRKINDDELENITNSLGYKGSEGTQLYKILEKGMREKVGFTKDVINDFVYYQNQHNGQMPSDAEKYKIIQNRLNQKAQQKKTQAEQTISNYSSNANLMRNIAYTQPKPNEQKVLTYFADNQIPTLEKQLGVKLTVTSRYRDQEGSHHKEGRACDVSMSEHSLNNRIRIIERIIALPNVHAIGSSDPAILTHFAGNKKLVDETQYDRQHGTNHRHHAHITLINANPATPTNDNIVAKNNVYSF